MIYPLGLRPSLLHLKQLTNYGYSFIDLKYRCKLFVTRPKSPASRFFTQSFIRVQIKENIKAPVTDLCVGNSPVTGEFPAQGTVAQKMLPFDDVIMQMST